MGFKLNVEPKLACERRHISSRPSDYLFMPHNIFKGETKGTSNIHSLGSRCWKPLFYKVVSIQRHKKPCYSREIHVRKRVEQNSPKPRHTSARGREESIELYSIP